MSDFQRGCIPPPRWFMGVINFLILFFSMLLAGCSLTTAYKAPEITVPDTWRIDYESSGEIINKKWWEQFNDSVLISLIETALRGNSNLRIAASRIEEYAANKQIIGSKSYPQLGYNQGASQNQNSIERGDYPVRERTYSAYNLATAVSWEVDLWGKLRNMRTAASEEANAMVELRKSIMLKLVSDVVTAYINLLNLDSQLKYARTTYVDRQALLNLFEAKWAGGQISMMELSQVRSSFTKVATEVPAIEQQIVQQENMLSILIGHFPEIIHRKMKLDDLNMLHIPKDLSPSIVLQRPDIKAIENRMVAAHARINVARLQYLPDISLSGFLGYTSQDLDKLVTGDANLWHVGQDLAGTIFSGGRIEGDIKQVEAQQKELLAEYDLAIKTAFQEINDTLVTFKKKKEILAASKKRLVIVEQYLEVAKNRFDSGYSSSYMEVVDAQRTLYNEQVRYSQTTYECHSAVVSIYKTMGGGWTDYYE